MSKVEPAVQISAKSWRVYDSGRVVNYAVGSTFGLKLMRRPSDDSIGTLFGLLIFLLAPSSFSTPRRQRAWGLYSLRYWVQSSGTWSDESVSGGHDFLGVVTMQGHEIRKVRSGIEDSYAWASCSESRLSDVTASGVLRPIIRPSSKSLSADIPRSCTVTPMIRRCVVLNGTKRCGSNTNVPPATLGSPSDPNRPNRNELLRITASSLVAFNY